MNNDAFHEPQLDLQTIDKNIIDMLSNKDILLSIKSYNMKDEKVKILIELLNIKRKAYRLQHRPYFESSYSRLIQLATINFAPNIHDSFSFLKYLIFQEMAGSDLFPSKLDSWYVCPNCKKKFQGKSLEKVTSADFIISEYCFAENPDLNHLNHYSCPLCEKRIEREKLRKGDYNDTACFIASTIYPADSSEICVLRTFRDDWIARKKGGNKIINLYYKNGPLIAIFVNKRILLKKIFKIIFSFIIEYYVKNTTIKTKKFRF